MAGRKNATILTTKKQAYNIIPGEKGYLYPELEGFTFGDSNSNGGKGSLCASGVILIQNVMIDRHGVNIPVLGIDNSQVLYAFGEAFGNVTIEALILTGDSEKEGKQPSTLIKEWETSSIVSNKKPCNLKWGGFEAKVYVYGLRIGVANTQYGILTATMHALIAPVKNKES